ncbi:YadA family autotransporter adhesin [Sphingomonas sp. R1]|uniref:YadA family autotransporter adhesin n=1 Tax=Sphingomonas sp. R1 TaxID=399176 RepID=UPI00222519FB|nr:YadA-like family protein [Sphingomonas sp. R1]UYY77313.1 YadA-like family protein [Sphingomonas sp. R1]
MSLSTGTATGIASVSTGLASLSTTTAQDFASLSTVLTPILAAASAGTQVVASVAGGMQSSTLFQTRGASGDTVKIADSVSCRQVDGIDTTATGLCAAAVADGATAYGSNARAESTNGTAIGFRAVATGAGATAVGYGNKAVGNQSIAIGFANVVTGAHSGAIGDPNVVSGDGSYAVGNNNTVASNGVFVLGNNVNVAAGNDGAVVLGDRSTASGPNTVSVGSESQTRRITNVADGIAPTDAATVGQLERSNMMLGNQIAGVQNQVYDLARSTSFGIAGATAMSLIPDIDPDQRVSIGMSVAGFNGYQAVALGITGRVGDSVKVKAGASISGGKSVYGAGIAFGW